MKKVVFFFAEWSLEETRLLLSCSGERVGFHCWPD